MYSTSDVSDLDARNQRGDRGQDPWKITAIRFLSDTGPAPLEIHEDSKPAFNADDVPLFSVRTPLSPQKQNKNIVRDGHPLRFFSGSATLILHTICKDC